MHSVDETGGCCRDGFVTGIPNDYVDEPVANASRGRRENSLDSMNEHSGVGIVWASADDVVECLVDGTGEGLPVQMSSGGTEEGGRVHISGAATEGP
jgi:hypothetical protein